MQLLYLLSHYDTLRGDLHLFQISPSKDLRRKKELQQMYVSFIHAAKSCYCYHDPLMDEVFRIGFNSTAEFMSVCGSREIDLVY